MIYFKKLLVVTVFVCIFTYCKGQSSDVRLIRSFLNGVLTQSFNNESEIANKCLTFCYPPSDSLNEEKLKLRYQFLRRNLDQIQEKYSKLYDSDTTPIVAYKDLDTDRQVPFDQEIINDVYGVIFSKDKIMYIWVKNDKIAAFDLYMQKGTGKNASAYFITY